MRNTKDFTPNPTAYTKHIGTIAILMAAGTIAAWFLAPALLITLATATAVITTALIIGLIHARVNQSESSEESLGEFLLEDNLGPWDSNEGALIEVDLDSCSHMSNESENLKNSKIWPLTSTGLFIFTMTLAAMLFMPIPALVITLQAVSAFFACQVVMITYHYHIQPFLTQDGDKVNTSEVSMPDSKSFSSNYQNTSGYGNGKSFRSWDVNIYEAKWPADLEV